MELLSLALAAVLVALNAFFVATEFALVKIRPTQIEELIRLDRPGARLVRKIVANIDAYLSACQLGITMASLALGWIGEEAFGRLLHPVFEAAGIVDPTWTKGISIAVAFVIITFLHITVGEQAPKSLAIMRPESLALAVAYPLRLFYVALYPFIWLINTFSLWMVRLTGMSVSTEHGHLPNEEELKMIVQQARSAGLLSASRGEVLKRAMSLPTKSADHLMVPRNEVAFLDINLSLEQNLTRARAAAHTRFPLCDRELDDVVGIIDIREVLFQLKDGAVDPNAVNLKTMAKPVHYFPELMSGERLLAEIRDRHIPMAVVVDEYGGASGIVTPADIISAVLGEFDDHDESDVVELPGGAFDVDGTATLDEVGEALKTHIDADDMRTVAGFLMERLGRMPRAGDRVVENHFVFHVVDVSGPRINRVRIQRERSRASPKRPPDA